MNGAVNINNCYLSFVIFDSQDCLYCLSHSYGHDNLDCIFTNLSKYCYSCRDIENCYECQECANCETCSSCYFCLDCRSSHDCIACWGLANSQFCIFNEQYSKEQFFELKNKLKLDSRLARQELTKKFESLTKDLKINTLINCQDCSGANLRNCNNTTYCYNNNDTRDSGYLVGGKKNIDCWKGYCNGSELSYMGNSVSSYNTHFSYHAFNSDSCWYSLGLYNNCHDCFGCVGLKKKSYCILNKQYSKEEYFELLPRIAEHMRSTQEFGQFFPLKYSFHSYEEGWGQTFLEDLPESELISRGYRSLPYISNTDTQATIKASNLEDLSTAIDENKLIGKAICCISTKQIFNFQKKEL